MKRLYDAFYFCSEFIRKNRYSIEGEREYTTVLSGFLMNQAGYPLKNGNRQAIEFKIEAEYRQASARRGQHPIIPDIQLSIAHHPQQKYKVTATMGRGKTTMDLFETLAVDQR